MQGHHSATGLGLRHHHCTSPPSQSCLGTGVHEAASRAASVSTLPLRCSSARSRSLTTDLWFTHRGTNPTILTMVPETGSLCVTLTLDQREGFQIEKQRKCPIQIGSGRNSNPKWRKRTVMRLPTWSLAVLSLPLTKSMADERETEPPGWVAWRAQTTGHRRETTRRRRAPQLGEHTRRRGASRRCHLIFLLRSP